MRLPSIFLVFTLLGCSPVVPKPPITAVVTGINVRDFGAKGDGVTDDRAAIQAAIDIGAGSTVFIPDGRYVVGKGKGYWCLLVREHTRLVGESREGTVLLQGVVGPSVRLLQVEDPNVTIDTMTLDGRRTLQTTVEEHRSGVFATGAPDLIVQNVTAKSFTGDGFYIHIGSDRPKLLNVLAFDNARNGVTFGGGTTGGQILNSVFRDNFVQQFDSEPGYAYTVDNLSIIGSTFDGGTASHDYAMTIAGSGADWKSKGWSISGNTINGTAEFGWSTDMDFRGNTCASSTGPCVFVYRATQRIAIADNHFALTGAPKAAVSIYGTGVNQSPSQIIVSNNVITTGPASAIGVYIISAQSVEITDNSMTGNGVAAPYVSGVYARSAITGVPIQSIVVKRNNIANFPAYGVMLTGVPGTLGFVEVSGNTFSAEPGAMPAAIWVDDSYGGPDDTRQFDNEIYGATKILVARPPTGVRTSWSNGDRWLKRAP